MSAGPAAKDKKRRIILICASALIFIGFVFYCEYDWRRETLSQMQFCTETIASAVWNMDSQGEVNFLKLLAEQNEYAMLTVSHAEGLRFFELTEPVISPLNRWLINIGLIRAYAFTIDVQHRNVRIGRISARRYNTNIYRYSYAFVVFLMISALGLHVQRLREARAYLDRWNQQLDRLVQTRTADLKALAEKYKAEIEERRQVQDALTNSEALLRTLIRSMPDLVWLKDPQGVYLTCNSRFERFFGATEKDIVGKTDYDFFDKETADFFRRHDMAAVAKGSPNINEEEVTYADDGHREYLETIKTPLRESDGRLIGVLGIGRDITTRKQAEEALRYQEMLLEEMGSIAHVGGWEFDPATGKGTWTKEVAKIYDLDPEDETSVETGLSYFRGMSRDLIEKAVADAGERGIPFDLELELTSAKGVHKWVHSRGRPRLSEGKVVQVLGSFQDITERKNAEMRFRENSERLRLALQAVRMGTWEWDIQANHVIWSSETLDIFGTDSDQFGGTYESYLSFATDDLRSEIDRQVREFLNQPSEAAIIQYEHEIIRNDGRKGWVEVRGTLFLDSQHQPSRMTGICADITARKQTDLEIERFRDHLEELVAERTAQLEAANQELESFSYSVSHDLRAPLRAIDGYSRILLEDYAPQLDDEGRRVCNVISDSARAMGKLIDDLLAFSRIGRSSLQRSRVNMAGLAQSIFYELTSDEERQRIDFSLGSLPDAYADPNLIRHVWVNLLSNAIKFSSKRERAAISIEGDRQGARATYRVKDNGAGFDMNYADKLFGVFQRLHRARDFDGTGVGLAIVQRIVHRHGGQISATATVGSGAEFRFVLEAGTGTIALAAEIKEN